MKIHLLSDLHLEGEPYTLPSDLAFDVLVAAGDISDDPKQAIEFLEGIGKPVVMVLGNHDYWSPSREELVDLHDRLAELRTLAEGTRVHVLEQEAVIIDGVRFLGTTFWTDYARNTHLANYAFRAMNDYGLIGAKHWLSDPGAVKDFERDCKELGLEPGRKGYFHPAIAFRWHQESKDWLRQELYRKQEGWTRTVIVTHHQPSYHCLLRSRAIEDSALNPHNWTRRLDYRWDNEGIYRVAAYASKCDEFIAGYQAQIDLWLCGHVHKAVDTAAGGVRVVANPRGYYDGESRGFDPERVIDLETHGGYMPALWPEIEESIGRLEPLLDDVKCLAPSVKHRNPVVRMAVRETLNTRLRAFHDEGVKIGGRISSNFAHLSNSFRDRFDLVAPGCNADVPSAVSWESYFGTRPDVPGIIETAENFMAALRRVPQFPALVAAEVDTRAQWGVEAARAAGFEVIVKPVRATHCNRNIRFYVSEEIQGDKHEALATLLDEAVNRSEERRGSRGFFVSLHGLDAIDEVWPW